MKPDYSFQLMVITIQLAIIMVLLANILNAVKGHE